MINFQYKNPSKIIFGQDSEKEIENLLKEYHVNSLLLIYSGDFIKELGIWDTVKQACSNLNITFNESANVVPNPKIELVRELVNIGKQHEVDFILAVGGGSAIDTAKAVSLGIPYDGDAWDFFAGKALPETSVAVGVITTLPSSGSETSNAAIISNDLSKLGFEDDMIIPKFAIMNPKFTLTLPKYQTSCGCADILSHLLERYFSDTLHVDTTDYMIEGAIKAVLLNSQRLMTNPRNIDARSEIQWLASIAHNGILDTGRVSDWGSHRIEHEISAQYGITHGEGMAVVFVAWCKYIANEKPEKLAQLANRIYGVDYQNYTAQEMALILADKLKEFFRSLGLKTTLGELGISATHFELMANRATNNDTQTVGHYIPLDNSRIIEILNLAL
ncbi:iron-containing alcohol dehydrogenase [Proteiniclasticum sp. C24MP]|uniref:iron-containing alcohol dehydrogenase n=1 Tax=Proteiniclasticum sp. C24MP TaxID=3374101 RepID=UPI003754F242